MEYAIVKNGIVVNIVVSQKALDKDWYEIPLGLHIGVGDMFDGEDYYDANGVKIQTDTELKFQKIKEQDVIKDKKIQVLTDINDFYEECLVEIASVIYS